MVLCLALDLVPGCNTLTLKNANKYPNMVGIILYNCKYPCPIFPYSKSTVSLDNCIGRVMYLYYVIEPGLIYNTSDAYMLVPGDSGGEGIVYNIVFFFFFLYT